MHSPPYPLSDLLLFLPFSSVPTPGFDWSGSLVTWHWMLNLVAGWRSHFKVAQWPLNSPKFFESWKKLLRFSNRVKPYPAVSVQAGQKVSKPVKNPVNPVLEQALLLSLLSTLYIHICCSLVPVWEYDFHRYFAFCRVGFNFCLLHCVALTVCFSKPLQCVRLFSICLGRVQHWL